MAKHRIAWAPGDGVGPELLGAARRLLDGLGLDVDYLPAAVGQVPWRAEGDPIPRAAQENLRIADCCLLGALVAEAPEAAAPTAGASEVADPLRRLRTELHLFSHVQRFRSLPGLPGDGVDLTLFRENVEDVHSGVEWFPVPQNLYEFLKANHPRMDRYQATPWDEIAISCRILTREGCRGIVEAAFEEAERRCLGRITVIEHSRVMPASSGLMLREARRAAPDHPGVELSELSMDAACRELQRRPEQFGIVVTSNLFGEILSEICAEQVGGPGVAAESNLGDAFALFRPAVAPDVAPPGEANPLGTFLAVARMLEWLQEPEAAARVDGAVAAVAAEGGVRPPDLGGSAKTAEVTEAVAAAL